MVSEEIFEKIKQMLIDQLDVDENILTMDTDIANDLDADSLDVVELIMAIEDEFNIAIPDEKIESIKTIGDLVKFIEEN